MDAARYVEPMPDEIACEVHRLAAQVRRRDVRPGDVISVSFDGPRWGSGRIKAELMALFPEQTVEIVDG